MKIVVCAKQVPDTTEVKLDPKTNTLIRDGVPSIINPDDKAGIEAALQLKEKVGGTVTVISMGPPQADAALREALSKKTHDKTVIIVAQRISTILNADQIIVLDEGKVVGIGTHEELMKNNETYRQIALSQLSEEELDKKGGN